MNQNIKPGMETHPGMELSICYLPSTAASTITTLCAVAIRTPAVTFS